MIRRFLRARDLDIEKASTLFLKYLSWRRSFVPNGSISPSEIPNELSHNKLFMQGVDKTGRPIVVVFGARHKQAKLEDFKRISFLPNLSLSSFLFILMIFIPCELKISYFCVFELHWFILMCHLRNLCRFCSLQP